MRLGLVTPVLTRNPRAHNDWEAAAGIDDVVAVAEAADRLGYHHVTCSEHVAVPAEAEPRRGATYWDPLATFGHLAAHTEQIRFATHVLVLGYHHPLEIAKRYGTLDQVSKGRLILGVGVGSLEQEFELLGAPFADRGPRADDALRALRSSLGQRQPEYHGEFYRFDDLVVDPPATRTDVPLWIGGRTARSLRRAVELGDGWAPFGVPPDDLTRWLDRARETDAWEARERPLDLIFYPDPSVDPLGDPDGTTELAGRYVDAGATILNLRLVHESLAHCVEQLEAAMALLA